MKFRIAERPARLAGGRRDALTVTGLSDQGLLDELKKYMEANGELEDPYLEPTVNAAMDAMETNVCAVELGGWTGPPTDKKRRRASGPLADHLSRLLKDPHVTTQGRDFRRLLVRGQKLDGEVYLLKRGIDNRPEPDPKRPPFSMTVHQRKEVEPVVRGGRWQGWSVCGVKVPDDALIQFKIPDRNSRIRGMDRAEVLRLTANIAWRARTYLDAYFANGAQTGGFFSTDVDMIPEQVSDFLEMFEQRHQGAENYNRVAVLPSGMKYSSAVQNHVHMELLKILEWARDEELTILRTPKEVLGLLDTATYSNGLTAHSGFWFENLFPLMNELEEGLNHPRKGLGVAFGGIYVGFDFKHVEDVLKRWGEKFDQLGKAIMSGVSRNDAVRILEIPVEEEEGGNVVLVPGNLVPIGQAGVQVAAPSAPASDDDDEDDDEGSDDGRAIDLDLLAEKVARHLKPERANRRGKRALRNHVLILRDRYERVIAREIETTMRAIRAAQLEALDPLDVDDGRGVRTDPDEADAYLLKTAAIKADMVERLTPIYEAALEEAIDSVADELGHELLVFEMQHPRAIALLETKAIQVQGVVDTVQEKLRDALREGFAANEHPRELKDRIREVMNGETKRSTAIARQESGEVINGGRYEAMDAEGVTEHEWSTARDGKVRESHQIDGQVVKIGERFSNGLRYPNDPQAPAEEVVGCRCVALAVD